MEVKRVLFSNLKKYRIKLAEMTDLCCCSGNLDTGKPRICWQGWQEGENNQACIHIQTGKTV